MESNFIESLGFSPEEKDSLKTELEHFEKSIQSDPQDFRSYVRLGTVFYYFDHLDQAYQAYQKALELNPENPKILVCVGLVLIAQGKVEEAAKEYFSKTLSEPKGCFGVGYCLMKYKTPLFDKASEMFRQAISKAPKNGDAYIHLGISLLYQGDQKGARDAYKQAIKANPNYKDAYNKRRALEDINFDEDGGFITQENDPTFALDYVFLANRTGDPSLMAGLKRECKKALEINPSDIRALRMLSLLLDAQGKVQKAHDRRMEILKSKYATYYDHFQLGWAFQRRNKYDDALACYKKCHEVEPGFLDAVVNLAAILQLQEKFEEAETFYRKALEIDATDGDTYFNFGITLNLLGKKDEAIVMYQKSLIFKPENEATYLNLGCIYANKGLEDEAITCYEKLLDMNPLHVDALFNLAKSKKNRELFPDALENLITAVTLSPADPGIHFLIGEVLVGMGQIGHAKMAFEKAKLYAPENAEIYFKVGRFYFILGEKQRGLSYLKTAKDLLKAKNPDPEQNPALKSALEEIESMEKELAQSKVVDQDSF